MSGRLQWLRSPRTLLIGLTIAGVLTVVIASSTSTAAFGAFNPAWDGASGIQEQASAVGTQNRIVLNSSVYDNVTPSETVALVLTPDRQYGPRDTERLRRFVERGGTLVVAEDFGPHSNRLLADIGATTRVDGRLLRDERYYYQSPNIVLANEVNRHPFTTDVDQLTLNHGTALVTNTSEESDVRILVNSSSFAYFDENQNGTLDESEQIGHRPVATVEPVGQGRVVVISDPSMMINAMLERPGNRRFVRTIFADHERLLLDYSHTESLPPLSYALVVVRDSGPVQALLGVLGMIVVTIVRRSWDAFTTRTTGSDAADPVSTEALVSQLRAEHPYWDTDRIERIARSRRRNRRQD